MDLLSYLANRTNLGSALGCCKVKPTEPTEKYQKPAILKYESNLIELWKHCTNANKEDNVNWRVLHVSVSPMGFYQIYRNTMRMTCDGFWELAPSLGIQLTVKQMDEEAYEVEGFRKYEI